MFGLCEQRFIHINNIFKEEKDMKIRELKWKQTTEHGQIGRIL
jgi:hypothetical protein